MKNLACSWKSSPGNRGDIRMTKRIVLSALILSCFLSIPARADDKDTQIAQLRAMVQQLIAENQQLRMQLANATGQNNPDRSASSSGVRRDAQPPVSSVASSSARSTRTVQTSESSYWMTTSSRKRHNSGCRYYKASNGRLCTKDEGIACKICGG